MDISPQRVRTAEFTSVKRGLDPAEVRSFLTEVAAELERAQNQSTAMEARARAAVARLQELSESAMSGSEPAPPTITTVTPSVDESETISRTLLLAQRTADTTVAEAQATAARIGREASDEAAKTLDSTREMSARLLEEAREEARRVGEAERGNVASEVNSLMARRDFLESDVDHLERHLADERSRLREAATTLLDLVERVPGGLGEVRRPLLSAADDEPADVAVQTSILDSIDYARHDTVDLPRVVDSDDIFDNSSYRSSDVSSSDDDDVDDSTSNDTDAFGTFRPTADDTGALFLGDDPDSSTDERS
jgi:DivIVA domain-containing protein